VISGVSTRREPLASRAKVAWDMIYDTWLRSADAPVGYPKVNVRDIGSGNVGQGGADMAAEPGAKHFF